MNSLVTWDDHGVLAWYGGAQQANVIHLQRLDTGLEVYGRPVALTDPTREAYEPSLARDVRHLLVAWYEKGPPSADFYVQVAMVDWSAQVKWHGVLSHAGRSGRNPVVRAAPDGAWVAWLESEDAERTAVWVEHLSAAGQPLAQAQRAGVADRDTAHLNAAVDATGVFYVVFDARLESRARELQLLTVDGSNARQHTLTHDDAAASVFPDIAIEGDRVALCWVDARDGHAAVRTAVGTRALLDKELDAGAVALTRASNQVGGSYLAWNHGQLAVAWNETGAGAGVFLQRVDGRGRPTGAPLRVAHTTAPAQAAVPSVAAWHKGFALVWNEYTEDHTAHRVISSTALRATVP